MSELVTATALQQERQKIVDELLRKACEATGADGMLVLVAPGSGDTFVSLSTGASLTPAEFGRLVQAIARQILSNAPALVGGGHVRDRIQVLL